jgi:hypothetical protein
MMISKDGDISRSADAVLSTVASILEASLYAGRTIEISTIVLPPMK